MDGLIYAYHVPRSTAQQQYTRERLAAIAGERKQKLQQQQRSKDGGGDDSVECIERTLTGESARSGGSSTTTEPLRQPQPQPQPQQQQQHRRDDSYYGRGMDHLRTGTSSSSGSSAHSEQAHQYLLNHPYELRYGRRYLQEVPYPLPCDLAEIQRQNLRTLLSCRVFGRPVCSPNLSKEVPRKVLEIGCGSGFWSATCHDYFASRGHKYVAFTGLDLAPLAPDLKKQGMNWTFVQHDIRRVPLPFDDGDFDMIMLKDLSLTLPLGPSYQKFLDEAIRILREGGTLEMWDSDYVLRSLLPHPPPPSKRPMDQDIADATATFLIAPGTPFTPAQNKYLQQANHWISEALDKRNLPPVPCARISQVLYQEPDSLKDIGLKRVAIPLGEQNRWERNTSRHTRHASELVDSPQSNKGKAKVGGGDNALTPDQAALRHTALLTVLQMIESMEPLLKEVSGKNSEEWSHWWASMMADLLDPSRGALTGECLEIGAWWATKVGGSDSSST